MIHLHNAAARAKVAGMIPGQVAKCSKLVPVGYDDDRAALRIAVSGPVDFSSQEAIRRMLGKGVTTYIGDESAIQSLLEQIYRPEELDLSNVPIYSSLTDLLEVSNNIVRSATDRRALNIQFELVEEFFWVRLDYEGMVHHQFYHHQGTRVPSEESLPERTWAFASAAVH
jgi:hypothetical protein